MKKLKEDDRDWSDDDAFNKWRISIGMTLHIEINAAWDAWRHLTPTPPAQECHHINKIGASPDGKTEHETWKCFDCGQPTISPREEAA